ncbi:hypothetical protein [Primorskyibacter sp. 2E233]|uniref:hypothetical protein n=1 Tax=Primorskyibacter sp. 2E233 TaxID=3413431 RepID=UPI003BF39282
MALDHAHREPVERLTLMLPDQSQPPEAALVTTILMQAYRDLFVTVRNESNASFTTQSDQDRAIEFLTDLSGGNARHRNALCALIGWDGDVLAARVRAMMEGDDFAPPTPDATPATLERNAAAVVRLRERWRHLQTPRQQRAA